MTYCKVNISKEWRTPKKNFGYVDGTSISRIKTKSPTSRNSTGVRGVTFNKATKMYVATLGFRGKHINLGSYCTLEEAKAARLYAEKQYHDPFIQKYEKIRRENNMNILEGFEQIQLTRKATEKATGNYLRINAHSQIAFSSEFENLAGKKFNVLISTDGKTLGFQQAEDGDVMLGKNKTARSPHINSRSLAKIVREKFNVEQGGKYKVTEIDGNLFTTFEKI